MSIPHIAGDSSLAFLADGYRFGQRRFDRLQTDIFTTRMMLKPVTLLRGMDAARFFYEGDRFTRDRALPISVLHSLQDEGSVQTLVGDHHRRRKSMFLQLFSPPHDTELVAEFDSSWERALQVWTATPSIVLHQAVAEVLTRTACRWAGVPLDDAQASARTDEFMAMIERAGAFGPRNWLARAKRLRTEAWARSVVHEARNGRVVSGSALHSIVTHREPDGSLLDDPTAATELINVLRPIVAIGRFIVDAAWALHQHPQWAMKFRSGDIVGIPEFVQEVRRFAPFFPVVGGRAATALEWHGTRFERDEWVLLDLFATNRHPALWSDPERFDPARFSSPVDRNALVPQGGGDAASGHRCPGEEPTVDLMAEAVRLLTTTMDYTVAPQDLSIYLRRIPALPGEGMTLSEVRPIQPLRIRS